MESDRRLNQQIQLEKVAIQVARKACDEIYDRLDLPEWTRHFVIDPIVYDNKLELAMPTVPGQKKLGKSNLKAARAP